MKKEYIILTILIVLLGAYLLFHKENTDNYTLPEIKEINIGDITSILIEKQDGPIRFTKNEDSWTLTDKNFPADISLVQTMLDTVKTFKLTALIAQKKDLKRYDLDKENKIDVTIFAGTKKVFGFSLGKGAPTFNHTFVMMAQDENVYHATGNFRNDFDKTVMDLRDKKVFEVKTDAVKQFSVTKDDISKTMVTKEIKNEKGETIKTWQSINNKADSKSVDKEKIKSFLSSISYLKCDNYPENREKKEFDSLKPHYSIQIDGQHKTALNLYKPADNDKIFGTSSGNEYVFVFNEFDRKKIMSAMDAFLGIKQEDKK